jgi:proline racemase
MLGLDASFSVVDSHTAGHPTRVVLSGVPPLPGDSVRARRDHFRKHHDDLRPLLLHEPRGHAAMVGLVPVPSTIADYGAFFISSYVYLDMCGHGTIGYARTLAATGALTREIAPERFSLETPAGVVDVRLDWAADGGLAGVRLRNVPSYLAAEDVTITLDGVGEVRADLAYGGMWYLLVDAGPLGLALDSEHVTPALSLGSRLKAAFNDVLHARGLIDPSDMASVLFYADADPADAPGEAAAARHLLVLEANKFDRSPCGTGTAARTAQLVHRGRIPLGGTYRAENLLGVAFAATAAAGTEVAGHRAVIVEIAGNAHIIAFSTIVRERGDPLPTGFLCR